MSQFQDIARMLLAAGVHMDPQRKGVYLLSVRSDNGSLISQLWTGERFDEKELIAESVRLNSTAAYLFASTEKSVVYISPSSTLCVARYSEDEEEWVVDESIPQYQVDRDGRVTAVVSSGEHVFFQNQEKQLVHLDGAWTPTVLPVNSVKGTPLLAMVVKGRVHLYYVSTGDQHLHCVSQQQGGGWTDNSLPYPFEAEVRQFVMVEADGSLFPIALNEQNQLLWYAADGGTTILGSVGSEGRFKPSSSEENTRLVRCAGCRGSRCPLFDFTNLRVVTSADSNGACRTIL